jgi:Arylsulfotransferase (ASST)
MPFLPAPIVSALRMLSRLPFRARVAQASAAAAFLAALALAGSVSASYAATTAPACVPSRLNESAALANGAVTVTPAPDTLDASYLTQISFLGPPSADIADVRVSGSRSGSHSGRLLAYSQGDGASFVPTKPFTQGEVVTIHAVLRGLTSSTPIAWRFTVAEVDSVSRSLETPPPPPPPPKSSELQHFVSRPDLQPPTVDVTANAGSSAPGNIFLAPYAGPGQYGPMILDGSGKLVWFKPIPAGERAADLRVQEYEGHPVLTWWQDPLVSGGQSDAGVVIADSAYKDIAIVRAGNGYQPDLHAFAISPRGTALFTVYDAIRCNLGTHGGPANGAVADTLFQEIDLRTGLVRFEWHALDHVPVADSYMPIGGGGTPLSPWDWFHINAVSEHGPNLLVDSRNTWAAYEVQAKGGQVLWRLGGKQSSFAMGPEAAPAYQHDVREEPDGTISFFDNGGTPKVHPQSRVIVLSLNRQKMTATLVSSFTHTPPLSAPSQGDFQPQADGNWFVGWGQEPYFSEFAPEGKLLFDAHLPALYQSYTVLKFPWTGEPPQPPRLVVRTGAHGGLVADASWNGATAVAQWVLLGGTSPYALSPLAVAPRSGFETAIASSSAPRYLAVQALGAQGQVLSTSAIVSP